MKCIDLMTLYQTQQCIKEQVQFIKIKGVDKYSTYRLSRKSQNEDFTDLWFEMLESNEKLNGKYISQHFSLFSDEKSEETRKKFWQKQSGKEVRICLIKIRPEIDKLGQNELLALIKLYMDDIEWKIFQTVDNADYILFAFGNSEKGVKELKQITLREQKIYESFYVLEGNFEGESENGFLINKLQIDEAPVLIENEEGANEKCRSLMEEVYCKIQECKNDKDKKWMAYYQMLYQLLNFLCQFEKKTNSRELFYIIYPSIHLFLKQLDKGKSKKFANVKSKYESRKTIERSVTEFIDSMENMIHHIGTSCANILNIGGRNGLPYDIPIKLCMLYLAEVHAITKIMNDAPYEYQFCISPIAYSRPTTKIYDFGLEAEDRLINISIARHELYSPRESFIILSHEVSHYVGSYRCRRKRAECYAEVCAAYLTEMLIPERKIMSQISSISRFTEEEKETIHDDIISRKEKVYGYFQEGIHGELKSKNTKEKHKYHFKKVNEDMRGIVRKLICDKSNILLLYSNEINEDMRQKILSEQGGKFDDVCRLEQEFFEENKIKILGERNFFENFNQVQRIFKEIYADVCSILLLNVDYVDYLESYLISESYILDKDTLNNIQINRVAVVRYVLEQEDIGWEGKIEHIGNNELNNNIYLLELHRRVNEYLSGYKDVKLENQRQGLYKKEIPKGEERIFDPLACTEIIDCEIEYIQTCIEKLKENIKKEENKYPLTLLREVYNHFKADFQGGDTSFLNFFDQYQKLVTYYKNNISEKIIQNDV